MRYYAIRFSVQKKNGDRFSFTPGNLFKYKKNALDHAIKFSSENTGDDETIDYELRTFIVVDD